LSKKGTVVRKLISNPRTRKAVIKLLAKPRVRRGVVRLAKNPRVRRAVANQIMRERFGQREPGRARRTYYGGAVGLVIGALVGRFARRETERTGTERARRTYYGGAVGVGIGAVVIVMLIPLLLWLLRRASRESGVVPRVRDLMTSEVVTVEPQTSIVDAARRMIQQEKGPLPVVEGDRPVAMVTDRDIIARVVAEGRDPNSLTVHDIATRELVTIGPDQAVEEAVRLMAEHQLDRILVVEGGLLVGIISEADVRIDEGPLT
jgi:CBS domain-containing protein